MLTDAEKAYLERLAEQAPPLSPESRRRLRPILAGTLAPVRRQLAREPQAA
jgi:hypothetical protein